ncbi:phage terminase small subunit [Paenibacillus alvei]|uniref:Phage terminase small subunit n=1 Tax=Paenibacillus alvei TaxID=44250 RepID=A0ABT4E9L4_PAEAL|nr:phage terminase small subunit [Paenibacillus alvei]MCY9529158.1 phage terminase small subunit [Paenibacillus alvei]
MSRERSQHREKAFKLWCEGGRTRKLASIARELGIRPELVRKWKSQDRWEERPDPKTRRGAPDGNKNALGNKGGAPHRNKNAVTHGMYETIWADMLDPEERIKMMEVETDPQKQVENEIRFLEIRERRMLMRINKLQDGWDSESSVSKHETFRKPIGVVPSFDEAGTMEMKKVYETVAVEVERTVKKPHVLERILAIEDALTRVQDKKGKFIELLDKINRGELNDEEKRVRIEKLKAETKLLNQKAW